MSATDLEVRVVPGAAPTLVLLHEGLGSVSHWKDFPERLAAASGRRVLVYSRRGYGTSPPLDAPRGPDFMHRAAFEELPAVLAAHAPTDTKAGRVVLVGHSDGASIALLYSARFPTPVVAMAPHLFVEDCTVANIRTAVVRYDEAIRPKLARHHADVDAAFHGWTRIWLDPAFRSWNIEKDVTPLSAPLLLVQGRDDPYGTLAQIAAAERAATGRVDTLVLGACGHSAHKDRPLAVTAAVTAFVAALDW